MFMPEAISCIDNINVLSVTISKKICRNSDVSVTTEDEKKQMEQLVDAFDKGKAPRRQVLLTCNFYE